MPHGSLAFAVRERCTATQKRSLSNISEPRCDGKNRRGIIYSNILPVHDAQPRAPSCSQRARESCRQWRFGTSPRAMAMKLEILASLAIRS